MRSILKVPHLPDLNVHQQCREPFPFATCASAEVAPRVHFPPTPTLTSIFITHSASVYDRTPAEVLPNSCALPGRHEREFVDTTCPRRSRRPWGRDTCQDAQASYFYPRAPEGPPESDDSDAVRTPPEPVLSRPPFAVPYGCRDPMLPYHPSQEEIQSALLFLPHASAPPSKHGPRRSRSQGRTRPKEPREESADGRIPRQSEFAVPTLDFEGCLGGF